MRRFHCGWLDLVQNVVLRVLRMHVFHGLPSIHVLKLTQPQICISSLLSCFFSRVPVISASSCLSLLQNDVYKRSQDRFHGHGLHPRLRSSYRLGSMETNTPKQKSFAQHVYLHALGRNRCQLGHRYHRMGFLGWNYRPDVSIVMSLTPSG